jgi:hypothetical protein
MYLLGKGGMLRSQQPQRSHACLCTVPRLLLSPPQQPAHATWQQAHIWSHK